MRRLRFALRPGWMLLHVVCIALVVTMIMLGRWQLSVSDAKHFSLQNFGYALQWWAFSAFVVAFWVRILRDAARRRARQAGGDIQEADVRAATDAPPAPEQAAYRRYVMPSAQQQTAPADEAHAAYNDYLARLAAQDAGNKQ